MQGLSYSVDDIKRALREIRECIPEDEIVFFEYKALEIVNAAEYFVRRLGDAQSNTL